MRVGQSRSPPVVGRVVLLPQEPDFARAFGEQNFTRETHGDGKSFSAFADEHDVAAVLHDRLGVARNILDVTDTAHRAHTSRGSMHAAASAFAHAFFILKHPHSD